MLGSRRPMPANVTPEYAKAEQRYRQALTDDERQAALQEMLSRIPKHKGTEKMGQVEGSSWTRPRGLLAMCIWRSVLAPGGAVGGVPGCRAVMGDLRARAGEHFSVIALTLTPHRTVASS